MTTKEPAPGTAGRSSTRSAYTHCIQCGKKLPKSNGQEGKADGVPTRSTEIAVIDGEVRFCTLRCAGSYGVDTARGWEHRGINLKHPAQREAEQAQKTTSPALQHALAGLEPLTTEEAMARQSREEPQK